MTLSYTPRFHLAIPDFLSEPWHAEFEVAMQSIDQALFTAIVASGTELWENNHSYTIGDIVIEPATGTLYAAAETHTSSSSVFALTFADERAAFPDRWTSFAVTAASQLEAEEGTDNSKYMTPLRVSQAIDAQSPVPGIASMAQAQEGSNNTEIMTPKRVFEGITARIATQVQAEAASDNSALMTPLRVHQQLLATGIAGGDQIGFSVHKNGVNQTGVASGVATKVTFTTELYDLGNFFDTAASRWTPPSGMMHIEGVVNVGSATVGSNLVLQLRKNGAEFRQGVTVVSSASGEYVSVEIDDAASGTDFYELFVVGVTTTTLTIGGLTINTYLMGHALGEVGTVTLGAGQIGFRAHKNNVTQNIPNNVATKVTFGFEDYDQGGYYNPVLSRWTPPVGLVHLDAGVFFESGASGPYALCQIYKNGIQYKQGVVALANASPGSQVSIDDSANGTDYYELFVTVGSGGVAVLTGQLVNTWFSGHFLGGSQGARGDVGPAGPDGAIAAPAINCGRLRLVSATLLSFTPYNGDRIKINGVLQQIPAAGIAGLSNTGVFKNSVGAQNLDANTTYYVYAFLNSGVVTADFSTTGHASSATSGNVGTEIRIGDDTRTLIGMIRTGGTGGVQFVDNAAIRFVLSWFNRRNKWLAGAGGDTYIGPQNIWAAWNFSMRISFLTWAEEVVHIGKHGFMISDAPQDLYTGISFDGVQSNGANLLCYVLTSIAGAYIPGAVEHSREYTEGFHFFDTAYFASTYNSRHQGQMTGWLFG